MVEEKEVKYPCPHESVGTLVYDPYRPGLKTRNAWWCILNVDTEIASYYRWWVKSRHWITLYPPAWKPHISVVRGEMPREASLRQLWGKYAHERVEFAYGNEPKLATGRQYAADDGQLWYVEAWSERLQEIRAELGLKTFYSYHLSIGKTYHA